MASEDVPHCPVCDSVATTTVWSASFWPSEWLPQTVHLMMCPDCEFSFNYPRPQEKELNAWYRLNDNDPLGSLNDVTTQARVEIQWRDIALHLPAVIEPGFRILDFGCGTGALLEHACQLNPEIEAVGIDVSRPRAGTRFAHYETLQSLHANHSEKPFDLIILSHTLEHMANFDLLHGLKDVLAPGGKLFVEVPDASSYQDYGRKTEGYYIDRLHINHFSPGSLCRLLTSCGWEVSSIRRGSCAYSDGRPYPVIQGFFAEAQSLTTSLLTYLEESKSRVRVRSRELGTYGDVIVWGIGDNLARLVNLGLLDGVNIRALVDGSASRVGHEVDVNGVQYVIEDPSAALASNPRVPVLVSSTWYHEEIVGRIHSLDGDAHRPITRL